MYQSLQSCRAIAAVLVVLFHLGGAMAIDKYFHIKPFYTYFSFGDSGVDFFFVLSGFIIYHAHRKDIGRPNALPAYLYKRIARVYPAYIIIFFGVYLFTFIAPGLSEPILTNTNIIKSILLLPQDPDEIGGTGAPVIPVAWTLQLEMLFYLAFSAGIINKKLGGLLLFLFLLLYTFGKNVDAPFLLRFLSSEYIWLFIMGMLCAKLLLLKNQRTINPWPLLGIGMLIYLTTAIDTVAERDQLKDIHTLLNGVAFSLIIIGLVLCERSGKVLLKYRFVQLLGAASYSLYLIHFPIIILLCNVSLQLGLKDAGFFAAFATYITIFVSCIIASIAFHLAIEKPITEKLQRMPHKNEREHRALGTK
jgi:peptidoglycan/LPS O-acetylase OafA/YrhL